MKNFKEKGWVRRHLKGFIAGIISASMILSSFAVFAENIEKIEAVDNVILNSTEITSENTYFSASHSNMKCRTAYFYVYQDTLYIDADREGSYIPDEFYWSNYYNERNLKTLWNKIQNSTSITQVSIGSNIVHIPSSLFSNFTKIEKVDVYGPIEYIGKEVFENCNNLKEINFSDLSNLEGSIGYKTFYKTKINSIDLSESKITSINGDAFSNCINLSTVLLPDTLKTIDYCVFYACESLKTINVPNSLKVIGNSAFEGAGLTKISIPASVNSIYCQAFRYCTNLTDVYIPDNMPKDLFNSGVVKNYTGFYDTGKWFDGTNATLYIDDCEGSINIRNIYNVKFLKEIKVDDIPEQFYYGSVVEPDINVYIADINTGNKTSLVKGTDYIVDYENNTYPGTGKTIITFIGNYSYKEAITKEFTITEGRVSNFVIKNLKNYTYTGSEIKPDIEVWVGNKKLTKDTHYTISYSNNINAGTATITITGKGSYVGTQTVNFEIYPVYISSTSISGIENSYDYTGNAIIPIPEITYKGLTLVKDVDYTLKYTNTTGPGFAAIKITGIGNFAGWIDCEYLISSEKDNGWTIEYIGEPLLYNYGQFPGINLDDVVITPISKGEYEIYFDYPSENTITNVRIYKNGELDYEADSIDVSEALIGYNCLCFNYGISGYTVSFPEYGSWYAGGEQIKSIDLKRDYTIGSTNNKVTQSKKSYLLRDWAYDYNYHDGYTPDGKHSDLYVMYEGEELDLDFVRDAVESGDLRFSAGDVIDIMFPYWDSDYVSTDFGFSSEYSRKHDFVAASLTIQPVEWAGMAFESQYGIGDDKQEAIYTGNPIILDKQYLITYHYFDIQDACNVRYEDNINVGTGKFIFTDTTGSLLGEYIIPIIINPADISGTFGSTIQGINTFNYTGEEITPIFDKIEVNYPDVNDDGYDELQLLKYGEDFEIIGYSNNTNLGLASATIQGIGNYTGTTTVNFNIISTPITDAVVTVNASNNDRMYRNQAVVLDNSAVSVECHGIALVEGTDYTVDHFEDNNAVGTAKVYIKGIGNYIGEAFGTFEIPPYNPNNDWDGEFDISDATVTVSDSYEYDGTEHEPIPTITYIHIDSRNPNIRVPMNLVENEDYTLSYEDNVEAGTGKAIVTGLGNFSGTSTELSDTGYFDISTHSIASDDISIADITGITYDRHEHREVPIITYNGMTLEKDTDFTVSYSDNVINVGDVTVTISGIGNYSGETTTTYHIGPRDGSRFTYYLIFFDDED